MLAPHRSVGSFFAYPDAKFINRHVVGPLMNLI